MSSWSLKAALAGLAIVATAAYAAAQMAPGRSGMHDRSDSREHRHGHMTGGPMHGSGMHGGRMGAPGTMGGDSALAREVGVIHDLLADHDRIRRTATNLPDGIRTVTESDEPRLAQLIKDHVATMGGRARAGDDPGLPIESPALRAIFRLKDKIRTSVETTANGVIVVQTSDDRETVATLQTHAAEVSELVQGGMAALHARMMRDGGGMHGMMHEAMMDGMHERMMERMHRPKDAPNRR